MAKLGFLGLGIMGGPMARNLIRAGHDVALWSHSAGKAAELGKLGGVACSTPAEVATRSECVFLCVGDTQHVHGGDPGAGGSGIAETPGR